MGQCGKCDESNEVKDFFYKRDVMMEAAIQAMLRMFTNNGFRAQEICFVLENIKRTVVDAYLDEEI